MAPRAWADLPPDLLLSITGPLTSLASYCHARAVCAAWRSALPPPCPAILAVADVPVPVARRTRGGPAHTRHLYALSLPARRRFQLTTLPSDGLRVVVGSGDGWLAVHETVSPWATSLVNPVTGAEVPLPHLRAAVTKLVLAPGPGPGDYAAVAICGVCTLACATARGVDLVVLDAIAGRRGSLTVTDLAYEAGSGRVYCLTDDGDVYVLRVPAGDGQHQQEQRPVTAEPLDAECCGAAFRPAAAFAPPYDTVSRLTRAKHIFLCAGGLYQLWWNTTCAISWWAPGGGRYRMAHGAVFLFRYAPGRRPCWEVAKDLGGHAVFVAKNNPVALRAEGLPGVRPNCVYLIDGWSGSKSKLVVFDVAAGTSWTLRPSHASEVQSTLRGINCWYFLDDDAMRASTTLQL